MIELRIAATNFVLIYALSCSVAGNEPISWTPSGYLTSSSPTWMNRNQQTVPNAFHPAVAATGDEYSAKDKTVSIAGYDKEIEELIEELQKVSKCLYDKTIEVNFYMINKGRYFHIDSVWTNLNVLEKTLDHYNHYFCLNKSYLDQVQRGDNDNRFYLNNLIMLQSSKDLKHILNLGKCKKVKVLNDEIEDTDDKVKIYVIKIDDAIEGDDAVTKGDENINEETAKMCKELNEHDCLYIINYGDKVKSNTSLEDVQNENLQELKETPLCKPQKFNNDEVTQNNEDMALVDEPVINENIKFYDHLPQQNSNVKCEKNNDTPNEIEPLASCEKVEPCNDLRTLNTSSTCNKPNDSVVPLETQFQVKTNLKPELLVKDKMTDDRATDSNEHANPCTHKKPKTEYYDNKNSISSTNNTNIPFCLNNLSTYNKIKPNSQLIQQKNLRQKPEINTSFSTLFSRWPIYFVPNYNPCIRPYGNIRVPSQNVPFSKIADIASKYPSLKNHKIFRKPDSNTISSVPTVELYAPYGNMNKEILWSHPLFSTFDRKAKPYNAIEAKITDNLKVNLPNYAHIEPTVPCKKYEKLIPFNSFEKSKLPFASKGQQKILSGISHRIPYSDIPTDSKTKPSPSCTCLMNKYPGPYNYFVPFGSAHKKPLTYPVLSDNKSKPSTPCKCLMNKYPGLYNNLIPVCSAHKKPLTYPVSDNKTKPSPPCKCLMNKYPGLYNNLIPVYSAHKKPLTYPVSDNKTKPSPPCKCLMNKYPGLYNNLIPVYSAHKKPLTYPVSDNKTKPSPPCKCLMNKYPGLYNNLIPVYSAHKKPLTYPVSDNKTKPSPPCKCLMNKYPGLYNNLVPVCSAHKNPLTYPVSDNKTKPSPPCKCLMNRYPGPYNYFVPFGSEHKKPLTYPVLSDNKTKPSPPCSCLMNRYPGPYNYFVPVGSEHKKPLTYPVSDNKTKPSPPCKCLMNKYPGLYNNLVPVCSAHKNPLTYPVSDNKTKPSPPCKCLMNRYPGPYNYFVPFGSEHKKPLTYPVLSDNKTKPSPPCSCLMNRYPGPYNYFVPVGSAHKKPLTYPVLSDNKTKPSPPCSCLMNRYPGPYNYFVPVGSAHKKPLTYPVLSDNKTKPSPPCSCLMNRYPGPYNYFVPVGSEHKKPLTYPVLSDNKTKPSPPYTCLINNYPGLYNYFVLVCREHQKPFTYPVSVSKTKPSPPCTSLWNKYPDLYDYFVPVVSGHDKPLTYPISTKICPFHYLPNSYKIPKSTTVDKSYPFVSNALSPIHEDNRPPCFNADPHNINSNTTKLKSTVPCKAKNEPIQYWPNYFIPIKNIEPLTLRHNPVFPFEKIKIIPEKIGSLSTYTPLKPESAATISLGQPEVQKIKVKPSIRKPERKNILNLNYNLGMPTFNKIVPVRPDPGHLRPIYEEQHRPCNKIRKKLKTCPTFGEPKSFYIPNLNITTTPLATGVYQQVPHSLTSTKPHNIKQLQLYVFSTYPVTNFRIPQVNRNIPLKESTVTPKPCPMATIRNLDSKILPKYSAAKILSDPCKDEMLIMKKLPYYVPLPIRTNNSKFTGFPHLTEVEENMQKYPKPCTKTPNVYTKFPIYLKTEPTKVCSDRVLPKPANLSPVNYKSHTIKPIKDIDPKYPIGLNPFYWVPNYDVKTAKPCSKIVPNKFSHNYSYPLPPGQIPICKLKPVTYLKEPYIKMAEEIDPTYQLLEPLSKIKPTLIADNKKSVPYKINYLTPLIRNLFSNLKKADPKANIFNNVIPFYKDNKKLYNLILADENSQSFSFAPVKIISKPNILAQIEPIVECHEKNIPFIDTKTTPYPNKETQKITSTKSSSKENKINKFRPIHLTPTNKDKPCPTKSMTSKIPSISNAKVPVYKEINKPYMKTSQPYPNLQLFNPYLHPYSTKILQKYPNSLAEPNPYWQYCKLPLYFEITKPWKPQNANMQTKNQTNLGPNIDLKKLAPMYADYVPCPDTPIIKLGTKLPYNSFYQPIQSPALYLPSTLTPKRIEAFPCHYLPDIVNTPIISKFKPIAVNKKEPYKLNILKPAYQQNKTPHTEPKISNTHFVPKLPGTPFFSENLPLLPYNFVVPRYLTKLKPAYAKSKGPIEIPCKKYLDIPRGQPYFASSTVPENSNSSLNYPLNLPTKKFSTDPMSPFSYNFNKNKLPFPSILNIDTSVPPKIPVLNTPTKLSSPYSLQLPKPCYTAFTGSPIPAKTSDIVLSPKSTDFGTRVLNKDTAVPPKTPLLNKPTKLSSPYSLPLPKPYYTAFTGLPIPAKANDIVLSPTFTDLGTTTPNFTCLKAVPFETKPRDKILRPHQPAFIRPYLDDKNGLKIISPKKKKEFRPLNSALIEFRPLDLYPFSTLEKQVTNNSVPPLSNIKQSIPLLQSTKPVPFWPKTQMYDDNLTKLPFHPYMRPLIKEKPTILLPPNILSKPQLKQSGSSVVTKAKKPMPLLDNTFIPCKGKVVCTPKVQPVETSRKLHLNPSPPRVVPIIPKESFKPSEPGQSLHYKGVKYPKQLVHIPKKFTDITEMVTRPIPTSINEYKTPVFVNFNKPTYTVKPHILSTPEIFTSLPFATVPELPILNRNVLKAHPSQISPLSRPNVHPKFNVVRKKDNLAPLSTCDSKSHAPSISPEAVILSSPPNRILSNVISPVSNKLPTIRPSLATPSSILPQSNLEAIYSPQGIYTNIPLLNDSKKTIINWPDRKPEIKLPFEPVNAYTVLPKIRVSKPVMNLHLMPQKSKPLWAINKYDSLKPNKIQNSPISIGHQNEFAPIKNNKLISLGRNEPNVFELPHPLVQNLNPTQANMRPNTLAEDPILNGHTNYFPTISAKPKINMDAKKLKLQKKFNELNDTIKKCVNKDNYAKDVLFNDREDIIIPITDIGIAKYTPNVSEKCHIIKTKNPYIFLKAWKSKLKLLQVKISFETEYFDSVNFVPVVMWNLPPKYVQKTAEDVITKLYAKPIVVQGVYSLDNSYAIVNGEFAFENRVVYVLWPTFCGNCVVFHGQKGQWRCNWSQCGV